MKSVQNNIEPFGFPGYSVQLKISVGKEKVDRTKEN